MWALRMIQSVPGMALMAAGETKPLLAAGVIRAHALPVVLLAAMSGAGLDTIAAIGAAFEMLTLAYVAARVGQLETGLGSGLAMRTAFLAPAGAIAVLASGASDAGAWQVWASLVICMPLIAMLAIAALPSLRRQTRAWLSGRQAANAQLAFSK
jgi:hypothetical protein